MPNPFEALPALLDRLGVRVEHVLHIGAHLGEEVPFYRTAGIRHFTFVEPQPECAGQLRAAFPYAAVVEAACGAAAGRAALSVNEIGTSSTLADPHPGDRITRSVPVDVTTVAAVASQDADLLVVDAQGLELDVLKGAGGRLQGFKVVICETCTVPDRTMASLHDDVVAFMEEAGFRVAAVWERSYTEIARYVRRCAAPDREGERVNDVVFVRAEAASCG